MMHFHFKTHEINVQSLDSCRFRAKSLLHMFHCSRLCGDVGISPGNSAQYDSFRFIPILIMSISFFLLVRVGVQC